MADKTWASPSVPRRLYDRLDEYAKSEEGQNQGFMTGKDILVMLMREFLNKKDLQKSNDENKKIVELPRYDSVDYESISLVSFSENRVVLKDNKINSDVILIFEKHSPIKCDFDSSPNCIHVSFCLQEKKLWDFVKKHEILVGQN